MFSCSRNAQIISVEKPQLKITNIDTHTWSDKAFNSTNVSRALQSLLGGSLEITLTVPLNCKASKNAWILPKAKRLNFRVFFKSFMTLLKSHSLWVTLYIRNIHTVIGSDKFLVRGNSQFHLARTLSLVYIQAVVIQRLVYSRFTVYTRDIFQVYSVY